VALLVAAAVICVGYAAHRGDDGHLNVDHATYLVTVHNMRGGAGYYPATDAALRRFIGPASTPRALRLPTIFLFWRVLPSDRAIWLVLCASVFVSTWLLSRLTTTSVVAAPAIAAYLLYNAWNKFTLVELWVLPLTAGAVVAWLRHRDRTAAGLALAAALVRETTAGLLLGGLVAAHRAKRARWPWLTAIGVLIGVSLLHAHLASPYLVEHGTESPLLLTGRPPWSVFRWMGFGLPLGPLVGPIVWALAVARVVRDRRLSDFMIFFLLMPIGGFLITRDYWGALLVPFTLAFAVDPVVEWLRDQFHRAPAPATG
jgi:hypothetical protein